MSDNFDLLDSNVESAKTASKKTADAYLNLEHNLTQSGEYERVEGTVALGDGKFQNKGFDNLVAAATKHYQDQIDAGVAPADVKKFYVPLRAAVYVPEVMGKDKKEGKLDVDALLALQQA